MPLRAGDTSRVDLLLIAEMVKPGARVLDIGCGDGTLLRLSGARSATSTGAASSSARRG